VTIRFAIGHFLSVVLWNWASISSRFFRYLAQSILGSRFWPFRVMWCHWSRDHSVYNRPFLICFFRWFFGYQCILQPPVFYTVL